jgi:hypothetical protein
MNQPSELPAKSRTILQAWRMTSDSGCTAANVTTIAATDVDVIAKMVNFSLMKSSCSEQLLLVLLDDRSCHN